MSTYIYMFIHQVINGLEYNICIFDTHTPAQVNVDMVIQTMKKNAEFARRLIVTSITLLSHEDCADTVKNAKVFYNITSQSNSGCC